MILFSSTEEAASVPRRLRTRLLSIRHAKWLVPLCRCFTLPLAVTRNRLAAPLCVFIFGIFFTFTFVYRGPSIGPVSRPHGFLNLKVTSGQHREKSSVGSINGHSVRPCLCMRHSPAPPHKGERPPQFKGNHYSTIFSPPCNGGHRGAHPEKPVTMLPDKQPIFARGMTTANLQVKTIQVDQAELTPLPFRLGNIDENFFARATAPRMKVNTPFASVFGR